MRRFESSYLLTPEPAILIILAFLSEPPDAADRHSVLHRRLAFLRQPASFFYDGDRTLRTEEITDPYRRGMPLTARATSRAERAWLREALGGKVTTATTDTDSRTPEAGH